MARSLSPRAHNEPLPEAKCPKPNENGCGADIQYNCEPCNKKFKSNRALLRHLRGNKNHIDSVDRPFVCPQDACNKTFVRAYDRERHQKEQHGDGKKACDRCGRVVRPKIQHQNIQGKICQQVDSVGKESVTTIDTDEICDGLCFLHLTNVKKDKLAGRLNLVEHLAIGESVFAPERRTALSVRSVPCGLCRENIPADRPQKLFKHLASHMEGFNRSYRCDECAINFAHKADLRVHRKSVERDQRCGFAFKHQTPCPGHHSPHISSKDNDRFDFCYRLREWELSQLRSHKSSVDLLLRTDVGFCPNLNSAPTLAAPPVYIDPFNSVPCVPTRPYGLIGWNQQPCSRIESSGISERYQQADGMTQPSIETERSMHLSQLGVMGDMDLTNLLGRFVCAGAVEQVRALLGHEFHVPISDTDGIIFLGYAVTSGSADMLDLLLTRNARMNRKYGWILPCGDSLLHLAASQGNGQAIGLLLNHGAFVNAKNCKAESALDVAIASSHIACALQLVRRGANTLPSQGTLTLAIIRGACTELVRHLIESGADCNERCFENADCSPLQQILILPFRNDGPCAMCDLIAHDATVHNPETDVLTRNPLLHNAVRCGVGVVQILLDAGADISATDSEGNSALHIAASIPDRTSVISTLIEAGTAIETQNIAGLTPLCYAVMAENNTANIQLLLEKGACPLRRTKDRKTAISIALDTGCKDNVRVLLNHWLPMSHIHTPVDVLVKVASDPDFTLLESFLKSGIEINKVYFHETALHRAAFQHKCVAIRNLLKAGANVNARSSSGATALFLASHNSNPFEEDAGVAIRILLDAGAYREDVDWGHQYYMENWGDLKGFLSDRAIT